LDHQHRQFPNKWLSALQSLPQPCELFTFHDLPDCGVRLTDVVEFSSRSGAVLKEI
jgi:hypothetical protein